MTYLFTLLFLAALIGVFRPYRFAPQVKRWHYGAAAFVCLIGVGATAPDPQPGSGAQAPGTAAADGGAADKADGAKAASAEKASQWVYDTSKDEMRGTERRFASLRSENTIDLDFPYGEQAGKITVRKDPQYGLDVMFSVDSGQVLCHGFGDSYISAKFDDGPIKRFNCTDASDGTSEVGFLTSPKPFLAALKSAKRTVLEVEFYQAGRQQFTFDTRNLEWE